MKTCPYCAEPIQAAAIICKHCHHNLVPMRARPLWRWARGMLIALGLWLALAVVAFYYSDDQQELRAFVAQRKAWHDKCWPIDQPLTPAGRDCLDERQALNALADSHGWDR